MEKEIEKFYDDYKEADLVYQTIDGRGIVEREGNAFTMKFYLPVTLNWMKLASVLQAEIREVDRWLMNQIGFPQKNFNTMFVDHEYEEEKYRDEEEAAAKRGENPDDTTSRKYMLFFANGGWMMYDNNKEYLFIWRGEYTLHLDDVEDEFRDSSWYPLRFIRSWYERVTGFENIDD